MESVTTPFGRRPMTLGMLASQLQSRDIDPDKSVDKWKLFRALCEARLRLGVTDRALALLNALLSFYPQQELSARSGLVVFPSNAQLSLRANGMAEATIRRHLASLVDAGLITRRDSANGKRYVRRDGDGSIGEAFGFSLAPLLARAEEIQAMAADVAEERLVFQRLRERLTIARRDVTKLIETALEEGVSGPWETLMLDVRVILAALGRNPAAADVAIALDAVSAIRDEIAKQLEKLRNAEKPSANDLQNERHIQNSKPESIYESEPLFEKEQGETAAPEQKGRREPPKTFPLNLVLTACPEIRPYGPGGEIGSWRDLMAAAVVARTVLGVSPSAYQSACEVLGPENAAVAIACILERGGHINSAGGYLRDLTRRAERGEFSVGPMLMSLWRQNSGGLKSVS